MRELLLPQAPGPWMISIVRCPGSPGNYVDLDDCADGSILLRMRPDAQIHAVEF